MDRREHVARRWAALRGYLPEAYTAALQFADTVIAIMDELANEPKKRSRRDGPATSQAAGAPFNPTQTERAILGFMREAGDGQWTAYEIANNLHWPRERVAKRLRAMHRKGLVHDTGNTEVHQTTRKRQIAWAVGPKPVQPEKTA